ncbi:MAG TPA: HEAT repeat domain-containing protein [Ktedonobacteraceae bacterium]|nr:HEAT repeat domain-containing protein [Ktedonobacteraceae bacterium]
MNQSQSAQFSVPAASFRGHLDHPSQNKVIDLLRQFRHATNSSITEFLQQIEKTNTPRQLNKLVNKLQSKLWNLPKAEQTLFQERLADILTTHVLQSEQRTLRLEAAGWLRMLTQAAHLPQPEQVFVTLVTSAMRESQLDKHERAAYLKMIVDCFWPFRYPYAAFTWEVYPANSVFYPLAPLFAHVDDYTQDILVMIFSELPTLDDPEIATYLLPVALQWAKHSDSERRQRITTILARMNLPEAQDTLRTLQSDANPLVRTSAQRAAEKEQRA